jgi:hypothetical protein
VRPLCQHLRSARPGPPQVGVYLTIRYYDGLTDGIVRCVSCRTYYYARAIAFSFWGQAPTHGSRVFAIYPMPSSAYNECEAVRLEWDRLHAAGRVKRGGITPALDRRLATLARRRRRPASIVCWELHKQTWLAIAAVPRKPRLPGPDAAARATQESDLAWFRYLGLKPRAA